MGKSIGLLGKIREELLEQQGKMLDIFLHPKKGLPELARSELMAGIKKSHRIIEENSNPNTQSQQRKEN